MLRAKSTETLNVAQLVNAGAVLLRETPATQRMQSVADELLSHKTAETMDWFTRNAAPKQDFLERRSLGHWDRQWRNKG